MTHSDDPHGRSAEPVHQGRPVEAQYVRQGRGGVRVLTILLISGVSAAVLLIGLAWITQGGFSNTNANDGDQAVDVRAFDGDAATPPAADAPTNSTGQAAPVATGEAPNVNAPTAPSN